MTTPDPLRATRRPTHRLRPDLQAGEAAAAVLAGERSRHVPRSRQPAPTASPSVPPSTVATAETLERLSAAQRSRSAIRIHYVAVDGRPAERELRSVRAEAGLVQGTDTATAQQVSIPLSRVSSVHPATAVSPLD